MICLGNYLFVMFCLDLMLLTIEISLIAFWENFVSFIACICTFLANTSVKKSSYQCRRLRGCRFWSLGQEDPIEKEMAIAPGFLSGKFYGQRSLMDSIVHRSQWVRHNWTLMQMHIYTLCVLYFFVNKLIAYIWPEWLFLLS